jgi:thiol-disulfide isomerase/thioredoxin
MPKTAKKTLLLLAIAAVLLGGCSQKSGNKNNLENNVQNENTETSKEEQKETGSAEGLTETDEKTDAEGETTSVKIAFSGQDLEGNTVSSEILSSSKLTMINVWATYCNPCLREMPELGELAADYSPEEFQIIGVISDVEEGSEEKMKDYAADLVAKTGADYTHLLLNESLYFSLLTEVSAVPTTFFFDSEGNLLNTIVGSMDKASWEEEINALLENL